MEFEPFMDLISIRFIAEAGDVLVIGRNVLELIVRIFAFNMIANY